jgi:hypothetical protein
MRVIEPSDPLECLTIHGQGLMREPRATRPEAMRNATSAVAATITTESAVERLGPDSRDDAQRPEDHTGKEKDRRRHRRFGSLVGERQREQCDRQGRAQGAHEPTDHIREHDLPRAQRRAEHILEVALALGLEEARRAVGERLAGDRHHEQPREDEAHVGQPLDVVDALAERAAEDGEEEHAGEHRRENRLRPQRHDAPRLAAGEGNGSAPLHDAQLRDSHARSASM